MLVLQRGILNHNPLNLCRVEGKPWDGELLKALPHDPRFAQFETPEMGLRAAVLNFQAGQNVHRCATWSALIARHAPPVENDTSRYGFVVAQITGYDLDAPARVHVWAAVQPFVAACIRMENGDFIYPENVWLATKTLLGAAVT